MDQLQLQRPLYVKMPIDQSWEATLALLNVLKKHAVQGVIFGNLTKDKTNPLVHPEDRKIWRQHKGNVSGKPTWKRSNKLIRLTREQFGSRFTIIGTGGIFNGQDAQEKMVAGADIVQLITGMVFKGPQVIGRINYHLAEQA
jgi:dihydroorotate dehydrogenase